MPAGAVSTIRMACWHQQRNLHPLIHIPLRTDSAGLDQLRRPTVAFARIILPAQLGGNLVFAGSFQAVNKMTEHRQPVEFHPEFRNSPELGIPSPELGNFRTRPRTSCCRTQVLNPALVTPPLWLIVNRPPMARRSGNFRLWCLTRS